MVNTALVPVQHFQILIYVVPFDECHRVADARVLLLQGILTEALSTPWTPRQLAILRRPPGSPETRLQALWLTLAEAAHVLTRFAANVAAEPAKTPAPAHTLSAATHKDAALPQLVSITCHAETWHLANTPTFALETPTSSDAAPLGAGNPDGAQTAPDSSSAALHTVSSPTGVLAAAATCCAAPCPALKVLTCTLAAPTLSSASPTSSPAGAPPAPAACCVTPWPGPKALVRAPATPPNDSAPPPVSAHPAGCTSARTTSSAKTPDKAASESSRAKKGRRTRFRGRK